MTWREVVEAPFRGGGSAALMVVKEPTNSRPRAARERQTRGLAERKEPTDS